MVNILESSSLVLPSSCKDVGVNKEAQSSALTSLLRSSETEQLSGCTWTEAFRFRQQPTGSHQKPSSLPRTTHTAQTAGVPQWHSNAGNLMLSDDFTENTSLQGPTLDRISSSKPETLVQIGTLCSQAALPGKNSIEILLQPFLAFMETTTSQ